MPDYTVKRIDEMEAAFHGSFVRARASLGLSAFGLQIINLPPDSGEIYPLHDHAFDGQEEVYLLVAGAAEMELPDAMVPMATDTFIRVGPSTRRRIRSGPDGCSFLIVGGTPGKAFAPSPYTELGGPEELPSPDAESSLIDDGLVTQAES